MIAAITFASSSLAAPRPRRPPLRPILPPSSRSISEKTGRRRTIRICSKVFFSTSSTSPPSPHATRGEVRPAFACTPAVLRTHTSQSLQPSSPPPPTAFDAESPSSPPEPTYRSATSLGLSASTARSSRSDSEASSLPSRRRSTDFPSLEVPSETSSKLSTAPSGSAPFSTRSPSQRPSRPGRSDRRRTFRASLLASRLGSLSGASRVLFHSGASWAPSVALRMPFRSQA